MSTNLIVNPYTQVHYHENVEIVLSAPKPGDSLRSLTITESEHKSIFEVFNDLAQVNLKFFDIEGDLSADERELLWENGVLIERENPPILPLFACLLSEVSPSPDRLDISSLIVNQTFRFEPFDLTKFASLVNEKHHSPYQPKATVVSPVSEIEIGYWLSAEESEIISQFQAGKKPHFLKDEDLLRRLIASEILVNPNHQIDRRQKWENIVNLGREKFGDDKYAVLTNLLPDAYLKAMRRFYREYVAQGFMTFGDQQVDKRFCEPNEPLASTIHRSFTKLVSLIADEEVVPSYVYAASYKNGAELTPHTDREQCEFSISFQVDYQPESPDQMSPWALYLEPLISTPELPINGISFGWESIYGKEESESSKVFLGSGDGLFYKGRELVHYRRALPEGHKSTSLFFHYVPSDFKGKLT